jgi:hypothetical protein
VAPTTASTAKPTTASSIPVKTQEESKPQTSGMLVADCMVRLHQGHTVPLSGVSPAEAMLLTALHRQNAGGAVVFDVKNEQKVQRTARQEVDRLRNKYRREKVDACFPGALPNLPATFQEAIDTGMETSIPEQEFMTFEIKA